MMAEKEVNKSEEVRSIAKAMKAKNENPRPVVIIEMLKKQGIEVSSPQVSQILKKMGFRPRKRRKAGKVAAAEGAVVKKVAVSNPGRAAMISVEDLIVAKKVIGQLGGTERALAAISALRRLEG